MAILSGFNLIRLVSAVHLVAGYFLVANPQRLAQSNMPVVLGQAIGVQQPQPSFWENRLGSSIAGLTLILSAISDLIALTNIEETARDYWGTQGIIRCTFFAFLGGYVWMKAPGRFNIDNSVPEPLVNSLVFTWAFFEAMWWFWIHINLRDERGAAQARIMQRRKHQKDLSKEVDDEEELQKHL